MGKPDSQSRFNQEQYEMLKRCSKSRDMTEWNGWRITNPSKDIFLEGANFQRAYMPNVLFNTDPSSGFTGNVHLGRAKFHGADLQNADFADADLQGAKFIGANLNAVDFRYACLKGADFSRAIVNGTTLIWRCKIDGKTKFEGVGLGNIRIYPDERQLLEYNIRRMNWEEWYSKHYFKKLPVRFFWALSDYGRSTPWVIWWFFWFAAIFASVYSLWPSFLNVDTGDGKLHGLWHAFYFSVVTMTTLGFGDIYANPDSWWGQLLLMVQVLLGYILLAAMVTRFAVLFLAGGPAGEFMEVDEETKKE